MDVIKVTIRSLSSFRTPIQSDTLFGNFCWVYMWLYGEKDLSKLLDNYSEEPSIVFSDGFPEGFLPAPYTSPLRMKDLDVIVKTSEIKEDFYVVYKKLKKIRYLHTNLISRVISEPFSSNGVVAAIIDSISRGDSMALNYSSFANFYRVTKNKVNRLTNRVEEGLYEVKEIDYLRPVDVYVKFDEKKISINRIAEILGKMGVIGYGADASTGKGKFVVEKVETEFMLKENFFNKGEKYFMSLSSGLFEKWEEVELIYGKTFTKFAKMGGDFASSGMYLKNPLILFTPGSIFRIKGGYDKAFFGEATDKVFSRGLNLKGNFVHSGLVIPFFINFKE